ncbi:MAG: hypothetical protein M9899_09035 [Bdellovibrionaceae bacterium]|nr:hypothetical protein [Pseudobdellovibrionaceae bacterium]
MKTQLRIGLLLSLLLVNGCQCSSDAPRTQAQIEESREFLRKIHAYKYVNNKRHVASLEDQIANIDPKKKNLCAITINSADEKEIFSEYLPHFNLIELADSGAKDQWFENACKADIKCDILVISGHFGGAFFGSSGLNLSTENLERTTCERTCPGILNAPKEVFLFGCNTLAGKIKDHRTPEEYVRVLVEDGFNELEAQNIAAIRYTPIGGSFHDRMVNIFAKVPKIYGFDSVGPSGRNVRPMLHNYFKEVGDYDQHLSQISHAKNNDFWSQALKVTTQQQTAGTTGEVFLDACPMIVAQTTEDKLQFILDSMYSEEVFLRRLFTIGDFARNENEDRRRNREDNNDPPSDREKEILKQIQQTQVPKKVMHDYLSGSVEGFLNVQMNLLSIGQYFNILTPKQIADYQNKILDLTKGITREKAEAICSYEMHLPELRFESLPKGKWDMFTVAGLACLHVKDHRIVEKGFHDIINNRDEIAQWAAREILKFGYKDPAIYQRMLSEFESKAKIYIDGSGEDEWGSYFDAVEVLKSVIAWENSEASKVLDIFTSPTYKTMLKQMEGSSKIDLIRLEYYVRTKHKLYDEVYLRQILEHSYPKEIAAYDLSEKSGHYANIEYERAIHVKFFVTNKLCSSMDLILEYERRIPEKSRYHYYEIREGYSLTSLDDSSTSTAGGITSDVNKLKISKALAEVCP